MFTICCRASTSPTARASCAWSRRCSIIDSRIFILAALLALPAAAKKRDLCFETHGKTSKKAAALFEKRKLQGGGPTWLAILEEVVKTRTRLVRPANPDE